METKESSPEEIEEIDESSSEKTKPYDPTKINITVKPLIIDSLIKRMKSDPMRIDLNTEFQRMGDLWDEKTQSRLIESLLVRIPLPAFYFDGTDDDNWKVVDGLQRLSTLKKFIIDKKLKLLNLEYLEQHEGLGFDELPSFLQSRIEETHITAYIINPGTPREVKYDIFKRINTGGLTLRPQEIRHAINQGIPADFVKELADLSEFVRATDNSIRKKKKRMEDRDFVTRFIGFYDGYDNYKPDLDSYLNNAMSHLNELTPKDREKIKNDFIKAMNAASDIFDNDAFRRRSKKDDNRKLLNKALFDTWSVNLAKLSENELKRLISKKEELKDKFIHLMNENGDFMKSIAYSTGDKKAVETRFSEINKLLRELLG